MGLCYAKIHLEKGGKLQNEDVATALGTFTIGLLFAIMSIIECKVKK